MPHGLLSSLTITSRREPDPESAPWRFVGGLKGLAGR